MKKLIASAAVLLTIGLSACSPSAEQVTLHVGDQVAGTETMLLAAGELDSLPYEIVWSTFTSGPPQIEALNAGQIDFAVTGNTPPIMGGDTSTAVISSYAAAGYGEALLVRDDSDINEVADLAGRKVAVARGSSAHGHLLLQLEKAGLGFSDLDVSYLQPADSKAAFENGQVDAWAVWDPYAALAEVDGARVLSTSAEFGPSYGFGVTSHRTLAEDTKIAALQDLLERIDRAQVWAEQHPEEWAEIYAAETRTRPEAALIHTRSTRLPVPLDNTVVTSQNSLIGAFHRAGVLPEDSDFADRLDTRFQAGLRPGAE